MSFNIPVTTPQIPTTIYPCSPIPTVPRPPIPPQTLTYTPQNRTTESDFDLHISQNESQTMNMKDVGDTSPPHDNSAGLKQDTTADSQGITISITPPRDPGTPPVDTATLQTRLNMLVRENIKLREENQKRLDEIQQATSQQIASLTDTVTRLTIWKHLRIPLCKHKRRKNKVTRESIHI